MSNLLTFYLLLVLPMLTSVLCMKAHSLYYIGVVVLLLNLSFQWAMVFVSYYFINAIHPLGGFFRGEENSRSFTTMCMVAKNAIGRDSIL